ncbi:hypothetical protein [Bosea sp. LjRoot237]|uniref:hypothetical protein n=1 Tax=Bosea sp. LjRoot237 TaxID=3342292 RepID=UPI003F505D71
MPKLSSCFRSSSGRSLARALGVGLFVLPAFGAALAAPFEFAPAPQTDLNRVYRIDKATGEVGACQFQLKEGGVGVTVCFPAGEGAGPQAPSDYVLVPSRHEREGGIFRANVRTGELSVCYVFDDKVVCTPMAK